MPYGIKGHGEESYVKSNEPVEKVRFEMIPYCQNAFSSFKAGSGPVFPFHVVWNTSLVMNCSPTVTPLSGRYAKAGP